MDDDMTADHTRNEIPQVWLIGGNKLRTNEKNIYHSNVWLIANPLCKASQNKENSVSYIIRIFQIQEVVAFIEKSCRVQKDIRYLNNWRGFRWPALLDPDTASSLLITLISLPLRADFDHPTLCHSLYEKRKEARAHDALSLRTPIVPPNTNSCPYSINSSDSGAEVSVYDSEENRYGVSGEPEDSENSNDGGHDFDGGIVATIYI